ncbi:hypothetical protein [Paraliobacillus sp. JSM ZJ581]|uniref:hypothetical protein n=1 Tax=Paraliobacillus sp. JSM ZJ581 TaxID=3342118 RepID=UPI0035A9A291
MKIFINLIFNHHLLHFRWLVNRINPYLVLDKRTVSLSIISTAFFLIPISYIFFLILFNISKNFGIDFSSTHIASNVYFLYYILLINYLIFSSFKEGYVRVFKSPDYHFLKLHKVKVNYILYAKLIDAFFLGIVIFILPLNIGFYFSFVKSFKNDLPISALIMIIPIIFFALLLRVLIMVFINILDNKPIISSVIGKFFIFISTIFIGWLTSNLLINKSTIGYENAIELLNRLQINSAFFSVKGIFLLTVVTLVILLINLLILKRVEKFIDKQRLEGSGKFKKNKLVLKHLIINSKSKSRVLNILYKDLILLFRGERLLGTFIKISFVLSGFSIGLVFTLSKDFYNRYQIGVIILIILVFQLFLANIISASMGKVSSIESERDWLTLYYPNLEKPHFIYIAKFILQFFICFFGVLFSTILLFFLSDFSIMIFISMIISAVCICLISVLSFILGSASFPNFHWESEEKINTSILGHIIQSIFTGLYGLINFTIIATNTSYLYAKKITLDTFLNEYIYINLVLTFVFGILIIIILQAPLWKGWKIK